VEGHRAALLQLRALCDVPLMQVDLTAMLLGGIVRQRLRRLDPAERSTHVQHLARDHSVGDARSLQIRAAWTLLLLHAVIILLAILLLILLLFLLIVFSLLLGKGAFLDCRGSVFSRLALGLPRPLLLLTLFFLQMLGQRAVSLLQH